MPRVGAEGSELKRAVVAWYQSLVRPKVKKLCSEMSWKQKVYSWEMARGGERGGTNHAGVG